MTFRFQARYALITYSQCGELDPWSVSDHFSALGAECIVGREHHVDGGTHLHVYVDFGRKFTCRRADVFDVAGFHPNIETSKGTPEKGFDYAVKDGDVVAGGLERPVPGRDSGNGSTHDKWTAITCAPSREDFWRLVFDLDPQRGACSWSSLAKYADWRYAPPRLEYESPGNVGYDEGRFDGRHDWLLQSGIGRGEPLVGKFSFYIGCAGQGKWCSV